MKRKMFLIGTMALMVAGSIFWSCQKDEFEIDSENGSMLKNGVIPDCSICIEDPVMIQTVVSKSTGNKNNPAITDYGVLSVWNTASDLIVIFTFNGTAGADGTSITIGSTVYSWVNSDPDVYSGGISDIVLASNGKILSYKVTHPLSATVACTPYIVNFASNGGPGGTLDAETTYEIYEYCSECDEANFSYETADNLDIKFKYNHDEEVENVTIQFNFPQVINATLNDDRKYIGADGKLYDVNNPTNQTVFTWTGRVSCSESEAETFHFEHAADCSSPSAKDGQALIWTDAKIIAINGVTLVDDPLTTDIYEGPISLKGSLSNIVYKGCPVNK